MTSTSTTYWAACWGLGVALALFAGCSAEGDGADGLEGANGGGGDRGEANADASAGDVGYATGSGGGTSTGTSYGDAASEDESDGGGYGADIASNSDAGTGSSDAGSLGQSCSAAYRELVNASGPKPAVGPIPWTIVDGATTSHRKKTVGGIWRGIEPLESPVQFDCPATADQLDLDCSVDRAFVVERSVNNSQEYIRIATALPEDEFEAPEEGTPVLLTFHDSESMNQLVLQRKSDGRRLLVIKAGGSEKAGSQYGEPESYVDEYGSFRVEISADIDDPETAYCLLSDYCDRLLRVERLRISAEQSAVVAPGEWGSFATKEVGYRFWHLASYRRNQRLGGESSCADVTEPAASYAFVRDGGA